jgi:NAD(P)-dependent dehydrogenase (short-subunit alcohol dehydrogenase family)
MKRAMSRYWHKADIPSETANHEVRAFGIRVVLIEPHYIRTETL